jgi:general secretion pathway protein C
MNTSLKTSLGLCAAVMAVWALLGGSAMYWALRLASGPEPVAMAAAAPVPVAPATGYALGSALGASPAASPPVSSTPAGASRFLLLGVVAGPSGHGAALISVDGKPARPFRPGAVVADGLVLQSVLARRATLGTAQGAPASITLEMAPPREGPSASTDKPAAAGGGRALI